MKIDTLLERISARIELIPESAFLPSIIDFTEEKRYMSEATTPVPGPFSRLIAPHMVEIVERFHPDDPCTHVTLKKSVQSTATTHAEFIMMFALCFKLGNVGFYTASRELADRRSKANIDVAIDDTDGMKAKIKPLSTRNVRKKGDSTFLKEFGGVKLTIDSFNSIGAMKSMTMRYVIIDEADEMEAELKGQGNTMSIIEGRTLAVRNPKIFINSTCSEMETSITHKMFMEADQRYYHMPCPLCGEMQTWVFMEQSKDHGFTYDVHKKSNRVVPDSVGYICKVCKKKFFEKSKQYCLENGVWIPTVVAQDPKKHSYHVSGLMSPTSMLDWQRIATKSAAHNKGNDVLKYKDFVINIMGNAWKSIKRQSKPDHFIENNLFDYVLGSVPEGVLVLYGGVDIQKDRLEYAVVGFGRGGVNYLIDHQVFYGKTYEPQDPVWLRLSDYIYQKTYTISTIEVHVSMVAIDTGWNPTKDHQPREKDYSSKGAVVYDFIATRLDKFIPIKGSGTLAGGSVVKPSRTDHPCVQNVYIMNASLMKDVLYTEISGSSTNAIRFPKHQYVSNMKTEIDNELILQLLSERLEETKPGHFKWKKKRARNEMLDIILYARAAAYLNNVHTWSENEWELYEITLTGVTR